MGLTQSEKSLKNHAELASWKPMGVKWLTRLILIIRAADMRSNHTRLRQNNIGLVPLAF
jgi:hypothetical protein